ncbi:hypothetical protein M427DRAFT_331360 [Gonapodya prolifera JEL478]|uniref:Uncharacterized protein n=1 Tax=Gonapodya prolifera (strain JEL478) TaxID=1344416 RepID=A0A139AEC2_GONPJ|nr:hypothetical protein M427DRAFT_331360 [Gonapodya prolifera JEL478]|eukprot:KXS15162.1 hypothetical protein M427DRAFT_331360 [Gonapodya prolifera JEL478]
MGSDRNDGRGAVECDGNEGALPGVGMPENAVGIFMPGGGAGIGPPGNGNIGIPGGGRPPDVAIPEKEGGKDGTGVGGVAPTALSSGGLAVIVMQSVSGIGTDVLHLPCRSLD